MLIIGLTGGIGSGKSAVSKLFSELGIPIIDSDVISRQAVAPGQPALQQICQTFGNEILTTNGELDRSKLKNIIFAAPAKRRQLEAILHPIIKDKMLHQASQLDSTY
ncbi:MAG TPA: dephospho-CoA kinase, partial [Candidatus Tenderia electrophaga]|nr:dephospho-CoA kinase [Candidatus Tenderia electrophaga]